MKQLIIYTDGGCWPNPGGKGGAAALIIDGDEIIELKQGYESTTNNRMEILSAILALESLAENCQITLFSDSQYLVKTMNGQFGIHRNHDLWTRLGKAKKGHYVKFKWTPGHSSNWQNNRCDELALLARTEKLIEDGGYEK